ncbi:MAG: phospho-N-acetylmuramoyl-pentapeptide-transferase [Bacteroidetes bacterium]|nr:MAG: phospho-N-acetylmuramoyl-pentapeptide-transferase [Bacteroidota bacterium]
MLYYLFNYLENTYNFPGAGMFEYLSFRAAMAVIFSLLISMVFGKRLIKMLKNNQVGETVRDLGLEGQKEKEKTPTMGGLIIIAAILLPVLLFAKLHNVYVILLIFSTLWLGLIGFLDDYIKVFRKNKKGLAGKFKILGQVVLGIVVGAVIFWNPQVVIKEKIKDKQEITLNHEKENLNSTHVYSAPSHSTKTTIPFVKNNELDYAKILKLFGVTDKRYAFLIFIPIVILIITAVSNGANLTDGIDGLAAGTSAIIGSTLGILAWISGNIIFSDYLNIMYIPNVGETSIFISAFVGACIGFLWYNTYPAQVFMGDTGSLTLGGLIAIIAIIIRKELLIPILCGIFFIENLSVILQVSWFKYTKKRSGVGKRIFKMSPLHHHYQVLGYKEPKIVLRFFIVGIILAVLTVITLKVR